MADLMWIQGATPPVSYTATEDRRVLGTIFTAGIVHGCDLSAGVGLVQVAAGTVAIPDGTAYGVYLAPYGGGASSQVTISTAGTYKVYAVANTTNGQAELLATTSTVAPTQPYVQLGTAVVAAGGAITTSASGATIADLRGIQGEYLYKLATTDASPVAQGGVYTWAQAHNFQSTIRATGGIALGPTAPALLPGGWYVNRVYSTGTPGAQNIESTATTYEVLGFDTADTTGHGASAGLCSIGGNYFLAPTSGYYMARFWIRAIQTSTGVLFGALTRGGNGAGTSGAELLSQCNVPLNQGDGLSGTSMYLHFAGYLAGSASPIHISAYHTGPSTIEIGVLRGSWGRVTGMNF